MKVAILTGGGDCPGLNAVIRAVVRRGLEYGHETVGVHEGWLGLIENDLAPLTRADVDGILALGGTIIGTSRTNPFKREGGAEQVMDNLKKNGIDAVVAVGGEDTLGVATRFGQLGMKVVGVPKTIDNDLQGTDYTFGFDTAVSIATEAIDRLHTTAESHRRVIVCEVMGRHTGHIAVHAGIAGNAAVILIPEAPINLDRVCELLTKRKQEGKRSSIVVVAEGSQLERGKDETVSAEVDEFGHVRLGGIGAYLATQIEQRTGIETRDVVLGHVQRGGTPTARDRVLATRYGVHATDLVHDGKFGMMSALHGDEIVAVPLSEATKELKRVNPELYKVAEVFFG